MRFIPVFLALLSVVPVSARQPVRARHGMVVAMEAIAADAGNAVLQSGGNAIDAAVATGFALATTHPSAGNLGGGGYMLIRLADGSTTFIDFREKAPGAASHDMYLDANGKLTRDSLEGWRAPGVPGTVRGFELAQARYGKLKWAEDLKPAVDLASKGYPLSYALSESLRNSRSLARDPESKRLYQKGGAGYEAGDIFVQPELAATLERISREGAKDFYEGETARILAAEMAKNGGIITLMT